MATLTDELIEEHRRSPLGPHTDSLGRIAHYLRRGLSGERHLVLSLSPDGPWRIGTISDDRSSGGLRLTEVEYRSAHEALHAVFLIRLAVARTKRTAVPVNDSPNALFAYADRFSAAPGETLTFYVSAEGLTSYEAKLVRLRHGYDGADGPGFRETELASSVDGRFEGTHRPSYAGSYVEVPDVDGVLHGLSSVFCEAFLFPTMPDAGRQGILGTWSDDRRAGWAVVIDGGGLHLAPGDGDRSGSCLWTHNSKPTRGIRSLLRTIMQPDARF